MRAGYERRMFMTHLELQIGSIFIKIESDISFETDESLQAFFVPQGEQTAYEFKMTQISAEEGPIVVTFSIKKDVWQLTEAEKKGYDDGVTVYKDKSHIIRQHTYADDKVERKGYCVRESSYNDRYDFYLAPETTFFTLRRDMIPLEEILAYHKTRIHMRNLGKDALRIVDAQEYLSVLSELLAEGRAVSLTVTGMSMAPFLKSGRDDVYLEPILSDVRAKDIVLFRRTTGQYVLHRIHRVKPIVWDDADCEVRNDNMAYYIVGDAQHIIEGPIKRDQLIGVVTRVKRKGKWITKGDFVWDFFAHVWRYTVRIRPLFWKGYRLLARIVKR